MTAEERVKQRYPMAEAVLFEGKWVIVGPRILGGKCPLRPALSTHCKTPEAAWESAARRLVKEGQS